MGATFASTLLGFMREVVSARYYGTRWEMDTFLAAATIPTILFGVFNGALVSALVPTFSEYLAHRKEDEAWRLASTTLNILAIVVTTCAVIGFFTARWYVPLIAHGFPAPQMGVAIHMTRWLMPSIVAVSLSGVLSAMLNAYHRFRAAALVGVAVNAVTIACVVLLTHDMQIYALVLGTVLGLTAQMLVQLPSFLSIGKYRLIIDLHHPGLKKIWVLLGPIIVGSAAGQLALFFDRFFASTLAPGYIAGMNYATKLVNFPQQIFAAAIATVIFPLLAAQFARENRRGVARSVVTGLRLVNFITIPSVCALIVLAHPMVQALFERGTLPGQRDRLDGRSAAVRGDRPDRPRRQRRADALLLRVPRDALAGDDLGRHRRRQRAALAGVAADASARAVCCLRTRSVKPCRRFSCCWSSGASFRGSSGERCCSRRARS